MNTQRILTIKAGALADVALIKYLLNQRPTAFGAAVVDTAGSEPEFSVVLEDKTPTLSTVLGFLEESKAFDRMVVFGELGEKFNPLDVQPFLVQDANNQTFMAIGIEGDFPKFTDPKSGHSEEFNLATKIIIPTLLDICETMDFDFAKVMAKVSGDLFNNNFLSHIGHRGSLTILPLEGEPVWLGKNELGNEYDWGQISNEHGYDTYLANLQKASEAKAAAAAPPPAPAPASKVSRFFKRADAVAEKPFATGLPPIIPQDVATAGDAPRTSVPAVKTVGATTVVDAKGHLDPQRPPSWVHKNSDIDMWYTYVAGSIPSAKKKRPAVIPRADIKLPVNLADLLELRSQQMKDSMKNSTVIANVEPIKQPVTATAAGAPKTGKEVAERRSEENLPIINAKDIEKIIETISTTATRAMTVAEMQDLEKRIDKFSTSTATSLQEMMGWPISAWFAIGKQDYRAVVLALFETFSHVRSGQKIEDLVGSEKVVTTVVKSGEGTVKTESVATGTKVGRFFKRNAA